LIAHLSAHCCSLTHLQTVITRAGILKKQEPKEEEDRLLLRALMDCSIPKFLKPDLPLFAGIISDLFPTTQHPHIDYGALLNALVLTCKEEGLQPVDSFIEKCIQLYDTTVVRHGVMLVGPTGGGKSSNIRILQKAMTRLKSLPGFARVITAYLNPKAVTQDQLYGFSDPYSNEWTDGTLAQVSPLTERGRECMTAGGGAWLMFASFSFVVSPSCRSSATTSMVRATRRSGPSSTARSTRSGSRT
jgi:hypothetical protein